MSRGEFVFWGRTFGAAMEKKVRPLGENLLEKMVVKRSDLSSNISFEKIN